MYAMYVQAPPWAWDQYRKQIQEPWICGKFVSKKIDLEFCFLFFKKQDPPELWSECMKAAQLFWSVQSMLPNWIEHIGKIGQVQTGGKQSSVHVIHVKTDGTPNVCLSHCKLHYLTTEDESKDRHVSEQVEVN